MYAESKRKFSRDVSTTTTAQGLLLDLSLVELFERFMAQKRTEGLAPKTLEDYELHFGYMVDFLGGDISKSEICVSMFREFIEWMLEERGLSPVTVNVRIRTMRAFVRFAFSEGYIDAPVHEKVKQLKTEQDTIEPFTISEVKLLFSVVDTSTFAGFRDLVMMCTLLDTMVRFSVIKAMLLY